MECGGDMTEYRFMSVRNFIEGVVVGSPLITS
jgi:hypothetical protein